VKLGWDVRDADRVCHAHAGFLAELRQLLPAERIIWLKMEEAALTYAANTVYGPGHKDFVELCVRGTEGHDFHVISPMAGEAVFLKFHPSGFSNLDFANYLKEKGIMQLVFTGVLQSRCVNATLITASSMGFECVALVNLLAGPAHLADEMKEHAKLTRFFYALDLNSKDFLARLAK
jgi:nicotinamidase-related amidase